MHTFSREDHLLVVLARLVASRLQQSQRIANLAIIAADVLPLESSGVNDGQLAEAVVHVVKNGSDVLLALARAELAVALEVSGRAVDEVSHGLSGIGAVGVVVDDGGSVDGTVHAEREETLVPVDVTVDSLVIRHLRILGLRSLTQRYTRRHHSQASGPRMPGGGAVGKRSRQSCTWDGGSWQ